METEREVVYANFYNLFNIQELQERLAVQIQRLDEKTEEERWCVEQIKEFEKICSSRSLLHLHLYTLRIDIETNQAQIDAIRQRIDEKSC